MSSMTDYLEQAILNHILRNTAYASPTTVYLALFTSDPTETGGGTEVSGSGYARQAVTFGAPAAQGNGYRCSNTGQIDFTASGGNFGNVSHVMLMDALTAGNGLYHDALASAVAVNDGDTLRFPVGDIDVDQDV